MMSQLLQCCAGSLSVDQKTTGTLRHSLWRSAEYSLPSLSSGLLVVLHHCKGRQIFQDSRNLSALDHTRHDDLASSKGTFSSSRLHTLLSTREARGGPSQKGKPPCGVQNHSTVVGTLGVHPWQPCCAPGALQYSHKLNRGHSLDRGGT